MEDNRCDPICQCNWVGGCWNRIETCSFGWTGNHTDMEVKYEKTLEQEKHIFCCPNCGQKLNQIGHAFVVGKLI